MKERGKGGGRNGSLDEKICANWGINLSKGGKCRICISIYTRVEKVCKIGIYHHCSDLFPSLHKLASYLR